MPLFAAGELRLADRDADRRRCPSIASRAVHDEVEEHLLDLRRVGDDGRRRLVELELELDVLAERAAQERLDASDDLDEAQQPRLEHLPPAEREQLARQLRGAVGCA